MQTPSLTVSEIQWGSQVYLQTLALRHEILRKPLGLVFDPGIFGAEAEDHHIVAKQGDWVVGCMILSKTTDAMKMRQVAVANELQRRGVGASMVRLAEEIAKNKHAKCMVLHARDTAIPFYLSMGYEIAGEGFMEVGIPHHAMRKSLVD